MSEPFAHLHLHSHYSLLDSAIKLDVLCKQVASLGMGHVALTDHGNLFGVYEFYGAARKAGVHPVFGCEVYVAPGSRLEKGGSQGGPRRHYHHLVLLAENLKGWHNLMELVTTSYLDGFYHKPRIDKELLSSHSEGLIGLAACLSGEVSVRLLGGDLKGAGEVACQYREILGKDNYFLEIQDHGLADEVTNREGVARLVQSTGIPIVATNDCHFHTRADVEAHRILIGIGQNKNLDELSRDYAYNDEFHVKSPEEMARQFSSWPGALARTHEIAARCHVSFPEDEFHLPRYPVPDNAPPEVYLDETAGAGLEMRLADGRIRSHAPAEYRKRLDFELSVISSMGFEGYFLVVWDFIRFAREHGIPVGPGRGSAAGSLVAYVLRITDIDPLQYDLLFERFLNPDRVSMPDIDIDFCQRRREEVIAHVRRLYGEENVSQIATFNVLQARSAIRDVGRVMGMSFGETDRIAKLVPETIGITLEEALEQSPRLAEEVAKNQAVADLISVGRRLEGLARHCGVHAAGVVIAPYPVRDIVPLYRTNKDEVVTQFDKDAIEKLGLLKMDFLGLKTLTVIDDCIRSIAASGAEPPDIERLGLDDRTVYELFSAGDTDGIFQFESSGMKDLLRAVQPARFEDIAALNALYRPGPMQWVGQFAERKHGRSKPVYMFPEMEEILAETYGVIVYQEQVMRIAVKIAGFSLARADTLRKAMGKKQKELIDQQGEHFVSGAVAKGYPRAKVEALWQQIIPFAQYGFNKSHSVAYAYVAYQTAYLKAHFRLHFWAAMLSSEIGNSEKLATYVALLGTLGIKILGPDVNASDVAFVVEGDSVRVGLGAVKGVGEGASHAIVDARGKVERLTGLPHMLRTVADRGINRKAVECLVRAGAFDSLHPDRLGLLVRLDRILEQATRHRQAMEVGQGFLFGFEEQEAEPDLPLPTVVDHDELLKGERETLGFYLSGHPLERWAKVLRELRAVCIGELQELKRDGAETATVGGLVTGLKVRPIKDGRNQGRRMASFTLEDQTGTVRVVAFADVFEKCERSLVETAPVLITAAIRSASDGEYVELGLEEIVPLDGIEARRAAALRIDLDVERHCSQEQLQLLFDVIQRHEGRTSVRFCLLSPEWRATLVPTRIIGVNPTTLLPELTALLGSGHVEYVFE